MVAKGGRGKEDRIVSLEARAMRRGKVIKDREGRCRGRRKMGGKGVEVEFEEDSGGWTVV